MTTSTKSNIIWETQKLLVQILKHGLPEINVYTSVPAKTDLPYIKISNINIENINEITNQQHRIDFAISIYTKGKTNNQTIEIFQSVCDVIESANQELASEVKEKTIVKLIATWVASCQIEEITERSAWHAKCNINVISSFV